jgi:hypothetical protein
VARAKFKILLNSFQIKLVASATDFRPHTHATRYLMKWFITNF